MLAYTMSALKERANSTSSMLQRLYPPIISVSTHMLIFLHPLIISAPTHNHCTHMLIFCTYS